MQITEIDKDEMGMFNKSLSREKMLLVCMENCKPCDQLFDTFQNIKDDKIIAEMDLFKIKLFHADEGKDEFIKAINVKFFPTLFYFKDGEYVARKQGAFGEKKPEKKLMTWIKSRRKNT